MTRNEIKLKAAKAKTATAGAKYQAVRDAEEFAVKDVIRRYDPKKRGAYRALCLARQEQTRAELAIHGITPMHTIFMYRTHAYAVRVGPEGYDRMFPVTKKNKRHASWVDYPTPYRWSDVRITDRCLMLGDE